MLRRTRTFKVHPLVYLPWQSPPDWELRLRMLEEKWKLKNGMRLTDGVHEYFYVKVAAGGKTKRSKPVVYAYRYYKNGNTYSTISKLEDWEIVK